MTAHASPKKWRWQKLGKVFLLAVTCVALWRVSLMFGRIAPETGLVEGRLRSCPESPNCVCSHATDTTHQISPLRINGEARDEWDRLLETIGKLPRMRVISRDERYMHVEFTTALMRFVDDVEFLLDEAAGVIQIRSASRIGRSDLGTNRKRMEQIRKLFEKG